LGLKFKVFPPNFNWPFGFPWGIFNHGRGLKFWAERLGGPFYPGGRLPKVNPQLKSLSKNPFEGT